MNRKNGNKRPRPSYEDGRLRDPSIEQMQEHAGVDQRESLFRLIRKAATGREDRASASH